MGFDLEGVEGEMSTTRREHPWVLSEWLRRRKLEAVRLEVERDRAVLIVRQRPVVDDDGQVVAQQTGLPGLEGDEEPLSTGVIG